MVMMKRYQIKESVSIDTKKAKKKKEKEKRRMINAF